MSDFRTGMSGACMSIKYLKVGILPQHIFVDPIDGNGYAKYVPERTCKVIELDAPIGEVHYKCSNCGSEHTTYKGELNLLEFNYCPICGAKVTDDSRCWIECGCDPCSKYPCEKIVE